MAMVDLSVLDASDDVRTGMGFKNVEELQPVSKIRKLPKDWRESMASGEPPLGSELLSGFLRRLPGAPTDEIKFVTRMAYLGDEGLAELTYVDAIALRADFPGLITGQSEDAEAWDQAAAVAELKKVRDGARDALAPFVGKLRENRKEYERFEELLWYSKQPVFRHYFCNYRVIGRGGFGLVWATRHEELGRTVAIKSLDRRAVKERNSLSHVQQEGLVLHRLADRPSPFCLRLIYSFFDSDFFYLVIPIATGGDLSFHLKQSKKGFKVYRARIYVAEIAVALGHLHALGIIYRDMKPENVLLDHTGHCKLSDFGLSVICGKDDEDGKFRGRAGTSGYWAPEVLRSREDNAFYDRRCDWWGLGVCLFEFLHGKNPFSTSLTGLKNRDEGTLDAEVVCPDKTGHGEKWTKKAKNLVKKLLERDVDKRLSSIEKFMAQKFFDGKIDWLEVHSRRVEAPWVPTPGTLYIDNQDMLREKDLKDQQYAHVKLTEEDDKVAHELIGEAYVNAAAHEADIVRLDELVRGSKDARIKSMSHFTGHQSGESGSGAGDSVKSSAACVVC